MCIVGEWFGDFVELPELMDIALRLSWEQLEATNVAFCSGRRDRAMMRLLVDVTVQLIMIRIGEW